MSFAASTVQSPAGMQSLTAGMPWMDPTDHEPAARPRSAGRALHVTQDQKIYSEGDAANIFFKVVSGVVRTCKFLHDGRRQIDAFHVAGDIFGVEAGTAYGYSAEAVCDCTVISYRRQELDDSAIRDAGFSRQLFSYAMRSLARAQEHALLLGRKSAIEKVAAFLVDWAGHSSDRGMIVLAMTRQDIADYLGLTIETVSRTLSHLEREGVIALASARQIRLTDPAALETLGS